LTDVRRDTIGFVFASQWPSLRAVRRLDVAAVVRERDT
jgi:hypothetical protein